MKELVKFIVEQFIEFPDKLSITEAPDSVDEQKTVMTICVAPTDMGKIIGKQGRIAKAIRTIVKSAQAKYEKKYSVEITENNN